MTTKGIRDDIITVDEEYGKNADPHVQQPKRFVLAFPGTDARVEFIPHGKTTTVHNHKDGYWKAVDMPTNCARATYRKCLSDGFKRIR